MTERNAARRWRAVALVAIGVAVGTTMTATPVYSHVGGSVQHLWKHLKPKTDARYYTKAQSDARFAGIGEKAADADLLDGLDSTDFLRVNGKAADANLLDGIDSSGFLRTTGKAADADLLDGVDSAAFQRACRSGTVHAIGLVRGSSTFSSTFVEVPESFTCWRGTGRVAARRISTGRYEIILSGSPFNTFCLSAPLVVGTIVNDDNNFFGYEPVACGSPLETRIVATNVSSGNTLQDGFFTFAWYRVL
jgi:hypothetical protein